MLEWILFGKGKMVMGGTRYAEEVGGRSLRRFLPLLAELSRINKVARIKNEAVDEEENRIRNLIDDPDFDDPHIAALLRVSRCRVLCTRDTRSLRYYKDRRLFSARAEPKVYQSRRNRSLLSDRYLADCCKPHHKTPMRRNAEILKLLGKAAD